MFLSTKQLIIMIILIIFASMIGGTATNIAVDEAHEMYIQQKIETNEPK